LAFDLPLWGAFFPKSVHQLFIPTAKVMNTWSTYDDFLHLEDLPPASIVLASGSPAARNEIMAKLGPQHDTFIFCCSTQFDKISLQDSVRLTRNIIAHASLQGLSPLEVNYSDFGGVTNASHLILCNGVGLHCFAAPPAMPRILAHLLDSAARGSFTPIERPCDIGHPIARSPIIGEGILRKEGLFDVHHPETHIACPSVFAATKWVSRRLTCKELLRAFDIPHSMDSVFKTRNNRSMVYQRPSNLACAITPLVVTAIFRDLWGDKGGSEASLERGRAKSQSTRQSWIDKTVIKEKDKEALLEDDNVSHFSSSNDSAPPELLLREVDSSSEESSSSERSTLLPLIVREGSSSCEE